VDALAVVWRGGAAAVLAVTALTILVLAVARAAARRTDVSVRRAVGASRRAIAGAAVVEGAAVAAVGVGGAALIATVTTAAWGRAWPGNVEAGPGFGMTLGASAAVVIAGALLPLVHARRRAVHAATGGEALGLGVPIAQFGCGLAALGLAARLAQRVTSGPASASLPERAAVIVAVEVPDHTAEPRAARYAALIDQVRADSPAHVAPVATPGTLLGLGTTDVALTDCGNCAWGMVFIQFHPVPTVHHVVSADTLRAIAVPLVAGRGITDGDTRVRRSSRW
jgi:hypothetical protein